MRKQKAVYFLENLMSRFVAKQYILIYFLAFLPVCVTLPPAAAVGPTNIIFVRLYIYYIYFGQ